MLLCKKLDRTLKNEKNDLAHFDRGGQKSTFAFRTRTPQQANTTCGHMLSTYCESLRVIGPVVVENDAKSAWGESSPWGTMGNPKTNFRMRHQTSTKL